MGQQQGSIISPAFQSYQVPNSAVPATAARPGSSHTYRSLNSPSLLVSQYSGVDNLYSNFLNGVKTSRFSPCLGYRLVKPDGTRGEYVWQDYETILHRAHNISAGFISLGLKPGSSVGIYSINRAEWVLTEIGAYSHKLVVVSLYDTLGAESVSYIVEQAGVSLIVASKDKIAHLFDMPKSALSAVRFIVQMEDDIDPTVFARCESLGIVLTTFAAVEKKGSVSSIVPNPACGEDLATIMYTSGTTGQPKGVLLYHKQLVSEVAAVALSGIQLYASDVYLSYLPLSHSFERVVMSVIFSVGAAAGFFGGDVLRLVDDMMALRPTLFASVPRLFNRIYDKITHAIESKRNTKLLWDWGYAAKKQQIDSGGTPENRFWDSLVFQHFKDKLGGRVRIIITGSAPISDNVYQFLQICFSCTVLQGYGLTETSAGCCLTKPGDWSCGHVGPPLPNFEVKLVDVPEMDYLTSCDTKVMSRGEICVRGPGLFSGYHKDPEKTREVIDSEGWFHTGDIGQFNQTGTLSIIDRKKNIFKLAQGEYIAVEFVESVYLKSRYVSQIFVYGDSLQNVLVAIVVPHATTLLNWASENRIAVEEGSSSPFESLCSNDLVRKFLLSELQRIAKEAHLRGFEFVKALYLTPKTWTVESGLVTPTFKNKRAELQKRFQKEITTLYEIWKQGDGYITLLLQNKIRSKFRQLLKLL